MVLELDVEGSQAITPAPPVTLISAIYNLKAAAVFPGSYITSS